VKDSRSNISIDGWFSGNIGFDMIVEDVNGVAVGVDLFIESKSDLELTTDWFNFNVGLSWDIDRTLDVDSSHQVLLSERRVGSNISSVGE